MMGSRPVVVIGDVFLDCVSELAEEDICSGSIRHQLHAGVWAPVSIELGGTGAQFAIAAQQVGFAPVALVGKVGGAQHSSQLTEDIAATYARRILLDNGVEPLWAVASTSPTGRSLILHLGGNRRVLVSDPLANSTFTRHDITDAMTAAVAQASIVHLSGYALLQPERRAAVLELVEVARAGGAVIAVDLAPHDIHRRMDCAELRQILRQDVDWVFVELATGCGVIGDDAPTLNPADTAGTIDRVLSALADLVPSVVLDAGSGRTVVAPAGGRANPSFSYIDGVRNHGLSARVQARILREYLGRPAGTGLEPESWTR